MRSSRRAHARLFLAAAVLAVTSGCARVAAVTDVHADGSMTRNLTFNGDSSEPPPGAKPGEGSAPIGPHLSDMIALPTKAAGWTVTRTRDGSTVTIVATRDIASGGAAQNDLGVKDVNASTAGTLQVENTATVRRISPTRLEYREVLHWHGARPADVVQPDSDITAAVRQALPAALASDTASQQHAIADIQAALWQALFGPGDPLLPKLMLHPDLAQFELQGQLRRVTRKALADAFGSRLSDADLNAAVAKIADLAALSTTTKAKKKSGSGGSGDSNSPPLVALLLRVQMPGKIVETNGKLDPDSGQAYWALYSEAPAMKDVVLTATSDSSGGS